MYENFDKKFDELYNASESEFKSVKEEKSKLLIKRKMSSAKLTFCLIAFIFCLAFGLGGWVVPNLSRLVPIICIILLVVFGKQISKLCKEQNIARNEHYESESKYYRLIGEKLKLPLLKEQFTIYNYDPVRNISDEEYKIASINEYYDYLTSNEYMEIPLLKKEDYEYIMSVTSAYTEINEYDEYTNNHYTVPQFTGTVGIIQLPFNINTTMSISSSDRDINKVELDMYKFNELFSVNCENEVVALSLLTSDNMDYLISLRENKYKFMFDIVIHNDKLYIRFYGRPIFNTKKDLFDKKIYEQSILNLKEVNNLATDILNMILESNIWG